MIPTIATATCCSCGQAVLLTELPADSRLRHRWQAHCERCIEPQSVMSPSVMGPGLLVGVGDLPQEALWDWQGKHDDAYAASVELTPAGREFTCVVECWRQATLELGRQSGWYRRVYQEEGKCVVVWGPNPFETAQRTAGAEMGAGQ